MIFRTFAHSLYLQRAPIAVGLLAGAVFAFPAQIHEIYVALAEDRSEKWIQILLGFGSIVLLSLILRRDALRSCATDQTHAESRNTTFKRLVSLWAIIATLLPLAGLTYGVFNAAGNIIPAQMVDALRESRVLLDYQNQNNLDLKLPDVYLQNATRADTLTSLLAITAFACVITFLALFALTITELWRRQRREHAVATVKGKQYAGLTTALGRYDWLLISALVVTIILITLFALPSTVTSVALQDLSIDLSQSFGALAIIGIFFSALAIFVGALTRFHDHHGIPILSLLIVVAVLASAFDQNDNHSVRQLDEPVPPLLTKWTGFEIEGETPERQAFVEWFNERPKTRKDYFHRLGKPYPVFIVAAEGGGIYAATSTLVFLSRLYDQCPMMAHHVFAISGISGGSIGAAFFTSAVRSKSDLLTKTLNNQLSSAHYRDGNLQQLCAAYQNSNSDDAGPVEQVANTILKEDFLAPVVGSLTFPDFLQRFIPYPPIEQFDRARVLEATFEHAWRNAAPQQTNFMAKTLRSSWQADGINPMLVLNTVQVETGAPFPLMPITHGRAWEHIQQRPIVPEGKDLSLSTAANLSARVALTPAGRATHEYGGRTVDGGYFENSGVEEVMRFVKALKGAFLKTTGTHIPQVSTATEGATVPAVVVHVIAITSDSGIPDFYDEPPQTLDRIREIFGFKSNLPSYFQTSDNANATHDQANEEERPEEKKKLRLEGFNEILSPMRALLRTRKIRGERAIENAQDFFKESKDPWVGKFVRIKLPHNLLKLPLGWQLSQFTRKLISNQMGSNAKCLDEDERLKRISMWNEVLNAKAENKEPDASNVVNAYNPDVTELANPIYEVQRLLDANNCTHREIIELMQVSGP